MGSVSQTLLSICISLIICMQYTKTEISITSDTVSFEKINKIYLSTTSYNLLVIHDPEFLKSTIITLNERIIQIKTLITTFTILIKPQVENDFPTDSYINSTASLSSHLNYLNSTLKSSENNFYKLQSISSHRKKRALINIGGFLSGLFGTASSDDLEKLASQVNSIKHQQSAILHAVEHYNSLINATNIEIQNNRHAINKVIASVIKINANIKKFVGRFEKHIEQLQMYTINFNAINLLLMELSNSITQIHRYVQDYKERLDILALGKLTPDILSVDDLKNVLADLKRNLPYYATLPYDPTTNIWSYYTNVQTKTVILDGKLLTILPIHLLDSKSHFKLYKIHNLIAPYHNNTLQSNSLKEISQLTAQ